MSTDTVSPLRQRMIEDMNARKLGAAAGPCRRDLSPSRAAEDSAGDEPGRDAPAARGRRQPQGARAAQCRLWLRPARRRGGQAEGQAHRQRAEDHSGGAVQGSQGPQCHAVARDARPAAPMVEDAPAGYDSTTPTAERWLFPGQRPGKPMTTRQLNRLFHEAADAAGIKKAVTLHALRHSLPPICWSAVRIFASSKHFWVTTNWTRRRATPASPPA